MYLPIASRALLTGVALVVAASPLAAQTRPAARVSRDAAHSRALADLQALQGTQPSSFDIYPEDPCAGNWTVDDPDGRFAAAVIRFEGLWVIHVQRQPGGEQNAVLKRLAPHTVRFMALGATYTMQCGAIGATLDKAIEQGGRAVHTTVRATAAAPSLAP